MRVDELRNVLGCGGAQRRRQALGCGRARDAGERRCAQLYRPMEAEALVKLGESGACGRFRERREHAACGDPRGRRDARRRGSRPGVRGQVGVVGYDLGKGADGLSLADDARAALGASAVTATSGPPRTSAARPA